MISITLAMTVDSLVSGGQVDWASYYWEQGESDEV